MHVGGICMNNEKKTNNKTSLGKELADLGVMILGGIGEGAIVGGLAKSVLPDDISPITKVGVGIVKVGAFFHGANTGHKLFDASGDFVKIGKDTVNKVKAFYAGANESDDGGSEDADPTEKFDDDLF